MMSGFTIGDVIRKTRVARRLSQTQLGDLASKFLLRTDDTRISKNTVSKVERDPYTSEFSTICRLLAALDLTWTDVDRQVGAPAFIEAKKLADAIEAHKSRLHGRVATARANSKTAKATVRK